jgi:hypothetical protein
LTAENAGADYMLVTMSFDMVKTMMHWIEFKKKYGNSLICRARIFNEQGIFLVWKNGTADKADISGCGGIGISYR